MRKPAFIVGTLAVAAVLVVGFLQLANKHSTTSLVTPALTRAQVSKPIAGAPAELAALRSRVNVLLPGGGKALDTQLAALKGHPVVVNVWASWCGPCRLELPFIQRQAVKNGARVAFVGVDAGDNHADATALQSRYPLPYPSFEDPDEKLVRRYHALGLPTTAFYDAKGKLQFVHQGQFRTESDLAAAIARYTRT